MSDEMRAMTRKALITVAEKLLASLYRGRSISAGEGIAFITNVRDALSMKMTIDRFDLTEIIGYVYSNEHVDPAGHAADAILSSAIIANDKTAGMYGLIRDLTDPDDCWFDHSGGCQAHGFFPEKPSEICPHARAKGWLAEHAPRARLSDHKHCDNCVVYLNCVTCCVCGDALPPYREDIEDYIQRLRTGIPRGAGKRDE